jgi:hypothetical protein
MEKKIWLKLSLKDRMFLFQREMANLISLNEFIKEHESDLNGANQQSKNN